MGIFDGLFGTRKPTPAPRAQAHTSDQIAVERYRHLLRTAPPLTIERAHAEAFSKLTEEQRTVLFNQLTASAAAGEAPRNTSAVALANSATRQEVRQRGTMVRSFAPTAPGSNYGGSLNGIIIGLVVGTTIASSFLPMDLGGGLGGADYGAGPGGGDLGGGFGF